MLMVTYIIIFITITILGVGGYFLLKTESNIDIEIVCDCPNGCDENGQCLENICDEPKIFNNGECICPPGTQGTNCQCIESKKPTDRSLDPCTGSGYVCKDSGWVYDSSNDCSKLYDMNGGTKATFQAQCSEQICSNERKNDPSHYYEVDCNSNGQSYCKKGCSKLPSSSDCSECKTDGLLNNGKTCACDPESGYRWTCRNQVQSGCNSNVPTNFCTQEQNPQCITCGSNSYSWHCSGTSAPESCVKKQYNLQSITVTDGTVWTMPENTTTQLTPVFPTVNNDKCKEGIVPYTFLNDTGQYVGSDSINSKRGFIKNNKQFTPYNLNSNYHVYNIKNYQKNPDRSLNTYESVVPTQGANDPLYRNKLGCMLPLSEVCNGNGSRTPECFDIARNPVACTDDNAWFRGLTDCICTPPYFGTNCESTGIPTRLITAWYPQVQNPTRTLASLTAPAGWAICNGQNGTPDLRGKFILMTTPNGENFGPKGDTKIGDTGGESQHVQTAAEVGSHRHWFSTVSKEGSNSGSVRTSVVNTYGAIDHDMTDLNTSDGANPKTDIISTSDRKTAQNQTNVLGGSKLGKRFNGGDKGLTPAVDYPFLTEDSTVSPMNNLPPYIALVYIMKI